MPKIIDNPRDQTHRESAETRLKRAEHQVLRERGVPEAEIPAAIEKMWKSWPTLRLPTVEELEELAARDEKH